VLVSPPHAAVGKTLVTVVANNMRGTILALRRFIGPSLQSSTLPIKHPLMTGQRQAVREMARPQSM
jgi:hypothetical protein